MTLRDTTITLTGLELVRVLRAYSSARCDAVGLGDPTEFDEAIEARAWEDDEDAWAACLASRRLRMGLGSLSGAKAFAEAVLNGEPVFTRQTGGEAG